MYNKTCFNLTTSAENQNKAFLTIHSQAESVTMKCNILSKQVLLNPNTTLLKPIQLQTILNCWNFSLVRVSHVWRQNIS